MNINFCIVSFKSIKKNRLKETGFKTKRERTTSTDFKLDFPKTLLLFNLSLDALPMQITYIEYIHGIQKSQIVQLSMHISKIFATKQMSVQFRTL